MKWLTRSHVHVDRVACPWLISRFVDSEAEFLFVPASQIEKVARETGAIPFDAPGVELGHKDGRCSFESIVARYELKDAALLRMAKVIHAADVASDIDTDPARTRPGSHCGRLQPALPRRRREPGSSVRGVRRSLRLVPAAGCHEAIGKCKSIGIQP